MRFSAVLIFSVIGQSIANTDSHVVHEQRESLAHHARWQILGTLPPDMTIPVRLAMKQPYLYKGVELLMEVSVERLCDPCQLFAI